MIDALTGLYNRSKFLELLRTMVGEAGKYNAPVGLLIIDVRQFHKINKRHGHDIGDLVLQAIAGVLRQVCRAGDCLGRIGDDQFALLLDRVLNPGHAQLAAMKIQRLLDVPVRIAEVEVRVNVTIGIALYPVNALEAGALLQCAELALETAKSIEKPIGYAEEKKKDEISEQWDIEISLSEAIAHSELQVFFQPKISLLTGKPVGAEALMRWENERRGLISPAVFLPVAETIGLIKPVTLWMLNSALRLSAEWTRKWGRLAVSVNIPPSIIEQSDFVDLVISADNLWERDNVDLCLEIVEQSLVNDVQAVFKKLNLLREHGVKVAIDDFGTGYSSLAYFRDLPSDELKIDQSFIQGLRSDKSNRHIVNLIIEIAHRFGLFVVAEGVEDQEVLMYLKKKGCDQVQGYYFARPLPADEFVDWLEHYHPEAALLVD